MKLKYTLVGLGLFCMYNQSTGMEEQKKNLTPEKFKREIAETALLISYNKDGCLEAFADYHDQWKHYSFQQMVVGIIGSSIIGLGSRNVEQKNPAKYIMCTLGIIGIGCTCIKLKNAITHFWRSYYIKNKKDEKDYLNKVNSIIQEDIYNVLSRARVKDGQLSPKEHLTRVQYKLDTQRTYSILTDFIAKDNIKDFLQRVENARSCTLSCPEY
ncbi:MAG TPA: hypothetical protein VGW78_02430 [Candidatus Babeliales bacterium]|nr:hypothetical protein [Candidatus Babeliales bacterium]